MAIVWRLSSIHFQDKTLIVGNVLRKMPFFEKNPRWDFRNLLRVLYSYFCAGYSNQKILIHTSTQTIETTTNYKGSFQLVTDFLIPENITITDTQNHLLPIIQQYPTVFQDTSSDFDIISDIDDTIVKSYTAHIFKRIGTILFKKPQKREVIDFTQKVLDSAKQQHARVFYLSKSESNLFFILTSFIEHHQLPKGPLLLTSYLKFQQLLRPKKGRNYKIDYIRFILENSKHKQFILLGDDSQRDVEIYTEIAQTYPNQIKQVYIRQTKEKPSNRQQIQITTLKSIGIEVTYFTSNEQYSLLKP